MFFLQILDPFEQLLPLVIPVPPPRLRQAEHESGRVRLLGRLEGGFEFLADAARLGFHPAQDRTAWQLLADCGSIYFPAPISGKSGTGLASAALQWKSRAVCSWPRG